MKKTIATVTEAAYNRLVETERFKVFDLPGKYSYIEPEDRHNVDRRTPLEFFGWCCAQRLLGVQELLNWDVPF